MTAAPPASRLRRSTYSPGRSASCPTHAMELSRMTTAAPSTTPSSPARPGSLVTNDPMLTTTRSLTKPPISRSSQLAAQSSQLVARSSAPNSRFPHRNPDAAFARDRLRFWVPGIHVSHDACTGVIREDPGETLCTLRRAICNDLGPGVDRLAHSDTTTVMNRHPGCAGGRVEQGVEDRPIGDRIRPVTHRFGLPIRRSDRPGVEMVTADDDRGSHLA